MLALHGTCVHYIEYQPVARGGPAWPTGIFSLALQRMRTLPQMLARCAQQHDFLNVLLPPGAEREHRA